MELPQPRPFGAEGRKSTHDFLSLYSPTQDPRSQGSFLKTHDFLQPLEQQSAKSPTNEEATHEVTTSEKPPPPAPPPPSGEHVLPGGIGTYSISHISYFNPAVLKPEGGIFSVARASSTDHNEENSNCSSYTGSGFTLWEESAAKKGKTGKENIVAERHVTKGPSAHKRQISSQLKIDRMAEAGVRSGGGHWPTSDRPSPSSTNTTATTTINNPRNANTAFSSLSSSQPHSYQKSQSFMDMLKSAKVNHDEDDEDEDGFVLKKEASPQLRGDLTVKVGSASGSGKSNDQKPNTPRSKHSATEQRRRSKINDRFQMLRELIPHSDQKRDKASFLLEVIEYIHYLQEKVHKHEGSFQGWNPEPPKLMPWVNSHRPTEGFVDQPRATNSGSGPGIIFPAKFDDNNIGHSPSYPRNGQNAVEPDVSSISSLKAIDHHSGLVNKAVLLPVPLQPHIFTPRESGGSLAQAPARLASDMGNMTCQPQSQWPNRLSATNEADASAKLKEPEMNIESGTISISSAYSQGLLNTLTEALQSSGVDLSQASVSVQIDLGKRANGRQSASTSIIKDNIHSSNPVVGCSRGASSGEDSDQALKKRKTS